MAEAPQIIASESASDESAALAGEAASLHAELAWVLSTECPDVFAKLRGLLEGCLAQLGDASATSNRNEPLRGESADAALRFALTLGPRDLQALQAQLTLPKWNKGGPWQAALPTAPCLPPTAPSLPPTAPYLHLGAWQAALSS